MGTNGRGPRVERADSSSPPRCAQIAVEQYRFLQRRHAADGFWERTLCRSRSGVCRFRCRRMGTRVRATGLRLHGMQNLVPVDGGGTSPATEVGHRDDGLIPLPGRQWTGFALAFHGQKRKPWMAALGNDLPPGKSLHYNHPGPRHGIRNLHTGTLLPGY